MIAYNEVGCTDRMSFKILQKVDLLGEGVQAFRVVQSPIPEGTQLPDPEPVRLTENARALANELRTELAESRGIDSMLIPSVEI